MLLILPKMWKINLILIRLPRFKLLRKTSEIWLGPLLARGVAAVFIQARRQCLKNSLALCHVS